MAANEYQVGGDHYNKDGKFQHWDMVVMFDLDYFQGQITKYLLRWRHKHNTPEKRLEDLKKARHFLDKYIESQDMTKPKMSELKDEDKAKQAELIWKLHSQPLKDLSTKEAGLGIPKTDVHQDIHWTCEGYLGGNPPQQVYKCKTCKKEVTAPGLDEAYRMHPDCLAAAYMNQP